MSMLNTSVSGGQAHTIIRRYADSGNIWEAIDEMHKHYASKGNITALQAQFHWELATMRLTSKYPGSASKFLQDFQMLYLDLEDDKGSTINDEEKVGHLSANVKAYANYTNIMANMNLLEKITNKTVFCRFNY